MTKRVHTILCWILTISLVWLPFAVSAKTTLSSINKDNCHEMNSSMPNHDMSVGNMHSAKLGQAVAIDLSKHEATMKKGCCGHCGNNCAACNGTVSCGHNSNHVSAFILFNIYSLESYPRIQFSIEQSVQYPNQIITPDFRPPIV